MGDFIIINTRDPTPLYYKMKRMKFFTKVDIYLKRYQIYDENNEKIFMVLLTVELFFCVLRFEPSLRVQGPL